MGLICEKLNCIFDTFIIGMNTFIKSLKIGLRFLAVSFVLTFLLILVFILIIGIPDKLISIFYLFSIPLYYYFFVGLFILVLSPLSQIPYLRYLVIVPKIVLDIFLLADIFVFNVYRFHIDMLFLNMLIHDFNGIGLSNTMLFFSFIAFLLVVLFNIWMFNKVTNWKSFKTKRLNLVLLYVFLVGQIIHVWAYEFKQQSITKFTPYFPYYLPLTSSSTMTKLKKCCPKLIPKPIEAAATDLGSAFSDNESSGTIFTYPKQRLTFKDSLAKKPNILFFLTESWRADMLSEDITPNIANFAKSSIEFTNHYSTGSVTVSGIFGLMYGLHPSYLKYAQSDPFKHQTVFTRSLAELGYDISAYSPSNFDRFSLKPMLYGDIPSENYINPRAGNSIENDRAVVDELIGDIQSATDENPWFKFVFLDSSHHNYKYPPENEKFLPIPKNSEAFMFNKNVDAAPFFNDYKNSLNYIDTLFGEIYEALLQKGLDENTIVIITSDHAEEFNDNGKGYWGHGSNFTSYQTAVPLILKFPENSEHHLEDKLSGHVDIVPTIMSHVLKCDNPINDYSSGYNLLALPEERGVVMLSYNDKAYLIGDMVYANGLSFESYHVDDYTMKNEDVDYKKINEIRKQETSFLNKN